jgi:[ribosomal protein S5]-alanine N-acetyltransferase
MLETPRLYIRLGEFSDISNILAYYRENETYLAPFEPYKDPSFYTVEHWKALLTQRSHDFYNDQSLKLLLYLKPTPASSSGRPTAAMAPSTPPEPTPDLTLIGCMNFGNFIRGVFQNCTVGYSLAERYQGQGYMYEALSAGIEYVFATLRFHRIEANYMPHNQRSGRLLKRLGFSVNGYARDYICINGQWQDHILTSLLNPTLSVPKDFF